MTCDSELIRPPQTINRRHLALVIFGNPLFLAVFLFVLAGRWTWTNGWLFILGFLATTMLALPFFRRAMPEIITTGRDAHPHVESRDRALHYSLLAAMASLFAVAALDDGRFAWSQVPWWVCAIGYVLLLAGKAAITWARAVNESFQTTVCIRPSNDQRVVDSGPYAFVRHPGYFASSLITISIALCLGSLWALIPAAVTIVLRIVRTHREDRVQADLAGYKDYAKRVRYRWIPGIW
jgi:protein-S-isoprenylcysteine O-methyltransferase Ste14